jgi:hypothetical protein
LYFFLIQDNKQFILKNKRKEGLDQPSYIFGRVAQSTSGLMVDAGRAGVLV